MRYTELLDARDNMIFEGDILISQANLEAHHDEEKYRVVFGFYKADERIVYGFYLKSIGYNTCHDMPQPDSLGRLKLINKTRN